MKYLCQLQFHDPLFPLRSSLPLYLFTSVPLWLRERSFAGTTNRTSKSDATLRYLAYAIFALRERDLDVLIAKRLVNLRMQLMDSLKAAFQVRQEAA